MVSGTDCTTNLPSGDGVVTFNDPPLTGILVQVESQVPGKTLSTIECNGQSSGPDSDPADLVVIAP